jgi:syntaxin-binding protein 1
MVLGKILRLESVLHPTLRDRIDKSQTARSQIRLFKVLNVEFYPRESHLITFRDPWSFPTLFHPACSSLIRQHLEDIAQKVYEKVTNKLSDFI